MKGLLLAGGHGTRLRPLTYTGNKHMLPIANKPMLLYGLEHLRRAGIKEVGVVLGPIREGVVETIGDGSSFGLKVTYISQPEPKGLAHAALISEEYMGSEPFVMYLGDNLLKQGVQDFVHAFEQKKADCVIGVCPVSEPSRYGIAELENGRVKRLVEKPSSTTSTLALVGVYVFGSSIFDAVKAIKPSGRNELEITDAIQVLVSQGKKVEIEHVKGWWKDTGTVGDLLEANRLMLDDLKTDIQGLVEEDSSVRGRVSTGTQSVIKRGATVMGPSIVGKGTVLGEKVYVGPYTSIGNNVVIRKGEVENSIIMDSCQIDTDERIVDSLIGPYSIITSRTDGGPKGKRFVVGERSTVEL